MPFTLRNEEQNNNLSLIGKMKNKTVISPKGNEEFNDNFLFQKQMDLMQ